MKKIMYGMTAVSAAIFILLSFFTYIVEIDNIAVTKVAFHIMTDEYYTFDELICNLNTACQASNTDILVRVYKRDNDTNNISSNVNIIYKTNNNDDFLKWHTEIGNCIVPSESVLTSNPDLFSTGYTPVKLYMPHIMGDYLIYSLTDMSQKDWSAVTCYTDIKYFDNLSIECEKYGIIIEKEGGIILSNNYWIILLGVTLVLLGLSFLSMLFWQLSESKKIAMKRLEGFSCLHIAWDSIVGFIKGFLLICILALFFGCIVNSIWENFSVFLCFLVDYKFRLLGYVAAWLSAMVLSCIYTVLVHPLYAIKGRRKQKALYGLTFFAKVCLIAVIGIVAYYSFAGFHTIQTTIAIQNNTSEIYYDYYHFLSNSNVNLISKEEMENLYHDFYITMSKYYKPVLMDASSAASLSKMSEDKLNEYNEHIENFSIINNNITVNNNYLDINPIYTSGKELISYDDFPDNKMVLLIPDDMDEEIVKNSYQNIAEFKGYGGDSIYIIKYDPSQRFYYFSTNIESEKSGYIEKPIVIIEQNFLHSAGWFSQGLIVFKAKSDDFYNEVLPLMNECGITKYIAGTVSLFGEIQDALNWDKTMMFIYVAVLASSLVLLCCILLYECIVYYKNNQKKITIQKMNGFSFWHVHQFHLFIRSIFYLIIVAYFLIVGCPLWFGLVVISVDFVCFYFVLESRTAKYAATVLKGDLS